LNNNHSNQSEKSNVNIKIKANLINQEDYLIESDTEKSVDYDYSKNDTNHIETN